MAFRAKVRPGARGSMKAKREDGEGRDKKKDDPRVCQTPVGRVGFCHVWEPHKFDDDDDEQEAKFSLSLVLDEDEDISAIKKSCIAAAYEKWGEAEAKKLASSGKLHLPYKRAAQEYAEYGEPYSDASEEQIMISAHTNQQPGIVNNRGKKLVDETDFYKGCYARMSVFCSAYEYRGKRGISLLLNNVQRASLGKKILGSRKDASEEFDNIENDDDDIVDDDDDAIFD